MGFFLSNEYHVGTEWVRLIDLLTAENDPSGCEYLDVPGDKSTSDRDPLWRSIPGDERWCYGIETHGFIDTTVQMG